MMTFHLDYSDLKRIIVEAVVLVCFSFSIGLTFNHQLLMNAFEGKIITEPAPVAVESIDQLPVPVALSEVREIMQRSVLVDARIPELYAEGHLPAAVSLPLAEIDQRFTAFKTEFPPNRSLIIYCSGYGCSDSFDLGIYLIKNGYTDIMVYEGGLPEWRAAGLPVKVGMP